jgi:hypothetical protein
MYDEDPMDSGDKCDYCELLAHCTCRLKSEARCFEPKDETGRKIFERAMHDEEK